MGIPYYFYTISRAYPGVILDKLPADIDHFFIDFNGMIHPSAQHVIASFEDAEAPEEAITELVLKKVLEDTESIIATVCPKIHTYICTDGVAPLAKINQQRKRRYLSSSEQGALWDKNCISPCTEFMKKLSAYMIENMVSSRRDITFSGSEEYGEGEHKIFRYIADAATKGRICIHGLDADLIMLSLCSHKEGIILMRDNTYIDIDALRRAIFSDIQTKYNWKIDDPKDTIETYVALCFLLGNDFIPHPVGLSLKNNGHEILLRAASKVYNFSAGGLILDGQINTEFLHKLLVELQKTEDADTLCIIQDYHKKHLTEVTKDPLVESILANPKCWRQLYYRGLFGSKDTSIIKNACQKFLDGIAFTYAYYTRKRYDSNYIYPYTYAPSIFDLANEVHAWKPTTVVETHQLDPVVQLLAILPLESGSLLPPKVRVLMQDPKYGCAHMFPSKFAVQTFLKTHKWECSPVLPAIDIPLLTSAIRG